MRLINDTHRKFREALEELFYRLVSRGLNGVWGSTAHTVTSRKWSPEFQLFNRNISPIPLTFYNSDFGLSQSLH